MSGAGLDPASEYPPCALKKALRASGIQGAPMDVGAGSGELDEEGGKERVDRGWEVAWRGWWVPARRGRSASMITYISAIIFHTEPRICTL